MKKMMMLLLTLVLVLAITPAAVFAVGPEGEVAQPEEILYVYDIAGLFTEEQYRNLQEQAMSVSNYSQCGVYFVAVDDFMAFSSYSDILTAAEDIYLTNGLGYGPEKNGILLLMSMSDRDYALLPTAVLLMRLLQTMVRKSCVITSWMIFLITIGMVGFWIIFWIVNICWIWLWKEHRWMSRVLRKGPCMKSITDLIPIMIRGIRRRNEICLRRCPWLCFRQGRYPW